VLILDTDHLTEFQKGTSAESLRLKSRLAQSNELFGTSIITVEEVMRGWMAAIRRSSDPSRQINSYRQLRLLFRFFATWDVFDWTIDSAARFQKLKTAKVRVGTMDLKIACIALANSATLLSRNLKDFEEVPGLKVLDWLS
jgi:tRNA(fMet)-specific endonuclease VapC